MLIDAVESYLAVRRAAGFKLREAEKLLCSFAHFASQRSEEHVRASTAIEWASMSSTPQQSRNRMMHLIRFARYIRAEDARHEIPPKDVFCQQWHRRPPHIFTPNEITRLLRAARRLRPAGSLRPHTYGTLLSLLAATGIRVCEALALRIDDLTEDGLVIRETKFRKSRLVPLHPTAAAGLEGYLVLRSRVGGGDDHILVCHRGRPLCYSTVQSAFHTILRKASLYPASPRRRPRLSDFRHTFAVRALETSPDGRDRIAQHMLALATYMGHSHIRNTYWYLHSTPQLMADIADDCRALFNGGRP